MTPADSSPRPQDAPADRPQQYIERQDVALGKLFAASHDMLAIAGFDGYFKQVNPAWERVLGWSTEQLTTRPYLSFVHPDDQNATATEAVNNTSGVRTLHFENRYRGRDGAYHWLSWTAVPSEGERLIYAAARDVTAQRYQAQLTHARLAVSRIAADAKDWGEASVAVAEALCKALDWDLAEVWQRPGAADVMQQREAWHRSDSKVEAFVNQRRGLTRERGESLVGLAWNDGSPLLMADVTTDPLYRDAEVARAQGMHGALAVPIRSEGTIECVLVLFTREVVGLGDQLMQTVSEVAVQIGALMDRLALQQRVLHMAYHDALTGLPNLTLFRERATHALAVSKRRGTPVAVGMVDLDAFKSINDTHGHGIGDEVLRQIAERLEGTLRVSDTVARLGGDEFGIILETLADESVDTVARKLRAALEPPLAVTTGPMRVRASIGFATTTAGALDLEHLVQAADQAMYADKRDRPPAQSRC